MAKKAPAKKVVAKHRFDAKRKGSPTKAKAQKKKPTKAERVAPRSVALPGMEQARHVVLDNAHEQIAEGRTRMASGRELEQEGIGIALQYMQANGVRAYRHAGVESVFVEGVSKLRVRLSKDAENAAGADTHAHDPVGDEGTVDIDDDEVPF